MLQCLTAGGAHAATVWHTQPLAWPSRYALRLLPAAQPFTLEDQLSSSSTVARLPHQQPSRHVSARGGPTRLEPATAPNSAAALLSLPPKPAPALLLRLCLLLGLPLVNLDFHVLSLNVNTNIDFQTHSN